MIEFLEDKYSHLRDCFTRDFVFEMWPDNIEFSSEQLLKILSHKTYSIEKDLGLHNRKYKPILDLFWPDRFKGNNNKLCIYILNSYKKKICTQCDIVKNLADFNTDNSSSDKLESRCRDCTIQNSKNYRINNKEAARLSSRNNYYKNKEQYIARAIQYKTRCINASPLWADLNKIKQIYAECPKGYHVDHIIPLKGKLVSGLHVESNLQYLTAEDNLKKSNHYEI